MQVIKVAFVMRVDALSKPGGDLIQIQKYIEWGKKLNAFEGHLFTSIFVNLEKYDIIHLTNIDRPVEAIWHFNRVKLLNKPIFISTIHHSYVEIKKYEKNARMGLLNLFSGKLNFQYNELLRSIFRSIRQPSLLLPTISAAFLGIKSGQRNVLLGSHKVLLLSEKEKSDLIFDFSLPSDIESFCIIRNGCEKISDIKISKIRDIDVCVIGRIEARKNQLNIIRALNQLGVSGIFIGSLNPNHKEYCRKFFDELKRGDSKYMGAITSDEVFNYLARSKVHVSASWFEVSSLVDLEATKSGCVVISSVCGATNELLGDNAFYVDPADYEQIKVTINAALLSSESVDQNISFNLTNFQKSWEDSVKVLISLYSEISIK